jgi:hypothetical protein
MAPADPGLIDPERQKFLDHCDYCAAVVSTWPAWKQEVGSQIMGGSHPIPEMEFLTRVYLLATQQVSHDAATDLVFDHIDRLLQDEKYAEVNAILERVDLVRLPSAVRRSLLTITFPAKEFLPARPPVYAKAVDLLGMAYGRELAVRKLKLLA